MNPERLFEFTNIAYFNWNTSTGWRHFYALRVGGLVEVVEVADALETSSQAVGDPFVCV